MSKRNYFTKHKHFNCNIQTIFRIRLSNTYTTHENQRAEEHEAGQNGLRNMTLKENPKLMRIKEALKETSI